MICWGASAGKLEIDLHLSLPLRVHHQPDHWPPLLLNTCTYTPPLITTRLRLSPLVIVRQLVSSSAWCFSSFRGRTSRRLFFGKRFLLFKLHVEILPLGVISGQIFVNPLKLATLILAVLQMFENFWRCVLSRKAADTRDEEWGKKHRSQRWHFQCEVGRNYLDTPQSTMFGGGLHRYLNENIYATGGFYSDETLSTNFINVMPADGYHLDFDYLDGLCDFPPSMAPSRLTWTSWPRHQLISIPP